MNRGWTTRALLAGALALTTTLGLACEEPGDPCDEFAAFAEALELRCGALTWDCELEYPTLGPERQQDLDWCLDCVREREEGTSERSCEAAPLSGDPCGPLLDETLDASCFSQP